jgi:hypothetical protein
MKTLYEKIITLYPGIKTEDNLLNDVVLRNDSDDRGDYIETWNNTEYTQPTQEELDAVE